jgi:hypothetical protein
MEQCWNNSESIKTRVKEVCNLLSITGVRRCVTSICSYTVTVMKHLKVIKMT